MINNSLKKSEKKNDSKTTAAILKMKTLKQAGVSESERQMS